MNIFNHFFPDYFTQLGRKSVLLALLLALLSFLIWMNLNPSKLSYDKKIIAILEEQKENVKHKESGSVSFYETKKGESLQNQDEIFTAENSSAVVKFVKSKTKLIIPAMSLVKIEEINNEQIIEVKQGVVDLQMEKGKEIKLRVNGEDHILKSNKDGSLVKAYLSNGKLELVSNDKELKINGEIRKNKFEILDPLPGEKKEVFDSLKIKLSEKDKYQVSLSQSANFEGKVIQMNVSSSEVVISDPLTEGEYFLKVKNGAIEKTIPFQIVSKYKIDGMSPAEGDLVSLNPGEKTKLTWNPKPVKRYKVTVKDEKGNEKKYLTTVNELTVDNLKGSSFEWSVVPEVVSGKYPVVQSKAQAGLKFTGKIELQSSLKRKYKTTEEQILLNVKSSAPTKYEIKLTNLQTGDLVFEKTQDNSELKIPLYKKGKFSLEIKSADFPSFQGINETIEISEPVGIWSKVNIKEVKAKDENEEVSLGLNFANVDHKNLKILYLANGKEKQVELKETIKLKLDQFGEHCFQVTTISPIPEYVDSDVHCVKYIQLPPFPPLPKAQDIIMNFVKHKGVDSYKITVPAIEGALKYRFEVYKDQKANSVVYTVDANEPTVFWASNRSGIYYLRYKVIDRKNRESNYSPVSKLIFPISPLSNW